MCPSDVTPIRAKRGGTERRYRELKKRGEIYKKKNYCVELTRKKKARCLHVINFSKKKKNADILK